MSGPAFPVSLFTHLAKAQERHENTDVGLPPAAPPEMNPMAIDSFRRTVPRFFIAAAWLTLSFLLRGAAGYAGVPDPAGPQDPGGGQTPGTPPAGNGGDPARPDRGARTRPLPARKARRAARARADASGAATKAESAKNPERTAGISFASDVAPILVANCVGCHSPGRPGVTRGKLELSSFARLMQGTSAEKVIEPGKPDESHLVLRVKGEETPRMPQGGNNNGLSESAIGKIEEWIRAGARLDAGLDPNAAMASYAASPDQVRRSQLARLSSKERDQKVIAAGQDRFRRTNPALAPETAAGEHFVVFSNLPKERAAGLLKSAEAVHGQLKRLLGAPATEWVEKVGVYVFNDPKDFIEFARTIENREVEPAVVSAANLRTAQPYIALVDPLAGKKEESNPPRHRPRARRGSQAKDESGTGLGGGSARSLAGLLADALGEAAVLAQGSSPRWLAYGVGSLLAAQVDPRNPALERLHAIALEKCREGWPTRAAQALGEGDDVSAEEIRAVGFAIVEFLMSPPYRAAFPALAQGMSKGKEKLDDVLRDVYRADRDTFLNRSGEWFLSRYGMN